MEHRAKHGLAVLGLALALLWQSVLAQSVQDNAQDEQTGAAVTLEAISVTGAVEDDAPIKIGNTAGASQEDIERRNAIVQSTHWQLMTNADTAREVAALVRQWLTAHPGKERVQ